MVKEIGININVEETVKNLKALYERTKEPIYLELYNYYNEITPVSNRDIKPNKKEIKSIQPSLFSE